MFVDVCCWNWAIIMFKASKQTVVVQSLQAPLSMDMRARLSNHVDTLTMLHYNVLLCPLAVVRLKSGITMDFTLNQLPNFHFDLAYCEPCDS